MSYLDILEQMAEVARERYSIMITEVLCSKPKTVKEMQWLQDHLELSKIRYERVMERLKKERLRNS